MHRRDGQLVEIIVLNQILANASLLTILFMLRLVEISRLAHLKERKCSTTNTRSSGMVERSVILSTVFDFLLINEVILVCSNNMMFTITWRRRQVQQEKVLFTFLRKFQSVSVLVWSVSRGLQILAISRLKQLKVAANQRCYTAPSEYKH
jgi:hypothetical protein